VYFLFLARSIKSTEARLFKLTPPVRNQSTIEFQPARAGGSE
jgi:hypothetical protein